jgi:hypothetical protein
MTLAIIAVVVLVVGALVVFCLDRIAAELGGIRMSVDAPLRARLDDISFHLSAISKIVERLAQEPPKEAQVEPWKIENEKRREIESTAKNLGPEEFVRFVAYRYQLAEDDPWVRGILKLRENVGLSAAVEAMFKRDGMR